MSANQIKEFLSTGHLGELAVGMQSSESIRILGPPESVGEGLAKTRIEAFSNRSLQVSHQAGVVILIGIYFASPDPPKLPRLVECEIPFSARTTLGDFEAYLEGHRIPWKRSVPILNECQVTLNVGTNVIATFENKCLTSLQSSAG